MRDQLKEIELQTYSKSYAFPVTSSASPLPYHWDGECHLVVNDHFYSHSPHSPQSPQSKPAALMDDLDFDVNFVTPFEKMDDCYPPCETQSVAAPSEASGSTAASFPEFEVPLPKAEPIRSKPQTLDAQLDFIMETSKKHAKVHVAEKKHKRNRKTPEQLDILAGEMETVQKMNFDKEKIREIAGKTGLSEIQVYKWYWDRRTKC